METLAGRRSDGGAGIIEGPHEGFLTALGSTPEKRGDRFSADDWVGVAEEIQDRVLNLRSQVQQTSDRQSPQTSRPNLRGDLRTQLRHCLRIDFLDYFPVVLPCLVIKQVKGAEKPLESELGKAVLGGQANLGVRAFDKSQEAGQCPRNSAAAELAQDAGLDLRIPVVVQCSQDDSIRLGPLKPLKGLGGRAAPAGLPWKSRCSTSGHA